MKKLGLILLLFLMVSLSLFSETQEERAFNERLEKTRYPYEVDFKGTPLSEVLAIISNMSGVRIMAASNTEKMPVDIYLPRGQNLKRILDTIKITNGLMYKLINDTMVFQSARNQLEFNISEFGTIEEKKFRKAFDEPLSTFSIDVDKASYSVVRNAIKFGEFPIKDMVRIEEFINYFNYDYKYKENNAPFSINCEIGNCDWNDKHKLAIIQLKGKELEEIKIPKSNLVFLVGISGSMDVSEKLPLVVKSLKLLAENMKDEDTVSIVVYAGREEVALPATKENKRIKMIIALDSLKAGGSAAGGEGISAAYKIAEENFIKGGNNRVILCTDGDFNEGVSDTESIVKIVEENKKKGIYLTIVGVGRDNLKNDRMEKMADKGDGNYFYLDSIREGKKVFVDELRRNIFTVAKDLKIQIKFNHAKVKEYKLIGYENRVMKNEDFKDDNKDAGELGAGDTVTAIYELVMNEPNEELKSGTKYIENSIKKEAYNSNEIMTIKTRYKDIENDKVKESEEVIKYSEEDKKENSTEFKFASAVAEFGLLLRGSEFRGNASYKNIGKLAREGKGLDYNGYRAEFIQMVELSELLDKRDLKEEDEKNRLKEKIILNNIKLEKIIYPVEIDFKGTPLSEILAIISKMSGITIVASTNIVNMPVDLSLPRGQSLKNIIDIIKTKNELSSKFINDTIVLYKESIVVN